MVSEQYQMHKYYSYCSIWGLKREGQTVVVTSKICFRAVCWSSYRLEQSTINTIVTHTYPQTNTIISHTHPQTHKIMHTHILNHQIHHNGLFLNELLSLLLVFSILGENCPCLHRRCNLEGDSTKPGLWTLDPSSV